MAENKRVQTVSAPAWILIAAGSKPGQQGLIDFTYLAQPLNVCVLCSFLTPSSDSRYTCPNNLQEEIATTAGPYPCGPEEEQVPAKLRAMEIRGIMAQ